MCGIGRVERVYETLASEAKQDEFKQPMTSRRINIILHQPNSELQLADRIIGTPHIRQISKFPTPMWTSFLRTTKPKLATKQTYPRPNQTSTTHRLKYPLELLSLHPHLIHFNF
jgi:hypothetical protein